MRTMILEYIRKNGGSGYPVGNAGTNSSVFLRGEGVSLASYAWCDHPVCGSCIHAILQNRLV